jgi:hypothetical protein
MAIQHEFCQQLEDRIDGHVSGKEAMVHELATEKSEISQSWTPVVGHSTWEYFGDFWELPLFGKI